MSAQARVFSGYRRLFRARRNLFEGDVQAMKESRVAIKQEFVKNRGAAVAGEQFEGLLTMVDEAEDMLRHGIARGNLNPGTGNYGTCKRLAASRATPSPSLFWFSRFPTFVVISDRN
jgi:hypothetical protein